MELLTLMAALFVATSFLFAPCASDQPNLQKSLHLKVHDHAKFTNLPSLPRKLKLNEEETVKNLYTAKDSMSSHKKFIDDPSSVTKQHEYEENTIVAAEKGRSRERVEEESSNKSEYFTMDYNWVRKRRPIHNKHVPFLP
ncbi:hypothetical protein ABFS82_12G089000 [Erythranthe guttata]